MEEQKQAPIKKHRTVNTIFYIIVAIVIVIGVVIFFAANQELYCSLQGKGLKQYPPEMFFTGCYEKTPDAGEPCIQPSDCSTGICEVKAWVPISNIEKEELKFTEDGYVQGTCYDLIGNSETHAELKKPLPREVWESHQNTERTPSSPSQYPLEYVSLIFYDF